MEKDLDEARRVAREVFRVEHLTPEQEDAILQVMADKNTILVGHFQSGRSLCSLVCHPDPCG